MTQYKHGTWYGEDITLNTKPPIQMVCINCNKLFLRKNNNMCQDCWNIFAVTIDEIDSEISMEPPTNNARKEGE